MLVDRDAAEKTQPATFVTESHDLEVADRGRSRKVIRLNRCAGRRTADHATPFENVFHQLVGLGAVIRIGEVPLSTTAKPDSCCVF